MSGKKTFLLVFLSLVLTAVSGILGSVPLRVLRRGLDHRVYWVLALVMVATLAFSGAYMLAGSFFAIAFLVGLFSMFHNTGFSLESSGLASVSFVSLISMVSLYLVDRKMDMGLVEKFKEQLTIYFANTQAFNDMNVDEMVNELVLQIPSGIFMALLVSLMVALLLEGRVMTWFNYPAVRIRLTNFRVPEFFIFVFIASVLGSFYTWPESMAYLKWIKTVSVNVLNVMILLYFFQGLAVLASYFIVFKVGAFWRMILTFVLVTQLFLFLSLMGVTDYWFDFRLRLARRAIEMNNRQL